MVQPRRSRFPHWLAAAAALFAGCEDRSAPPPASSPSIVTCGGVPRVAPAPAAVDALCPPRVGRLDKSLVPECSGFVASRKFPGVYWALNDSGDRARIVAVNAFGETVRPASAANYAGLSVTGAKNTDWEAVALDGAGRLILGDFGNNLSRRRDLCLYVVPSEPDPRRDTATAPARRVPFYFVDQAKFPDPKKNHDAEAMFCHAGSVYVFTKHWSDTASELHRVDMTAPENEPRPTTLVASFEARGMVTDAAVSPDSRRLAVLTYTGLWVFSLPADARAHPLSGKALFRPLAMPLSSWQVEAVAFTDDDTLLVGSEEGDLYSVRVSDLAAAK